MKTYFTENDPAEELAALAPAEIRWAKNPRMLDAHEQLVIGPNSTWMGDCMRRDPTKRDAFQSFNVDCPEAAGRRLFGRKEFTDCENVGWDQTGKTQPEGGGDKVESGLVLGEGEGRYCTGLSQ